MPFRFLNLVVEIIPNIQTSTKHLTTLLSILPTSVDQTALHLQRSSSRSPKKAQPSTSLRMEDVSSHFTTMPHTSYESPSLNSMFDPQNTKKIMAAFRRQAEIRQNCCAIMGVGRVPSFLFHHPCQGAG